VRGGEGAHLLHQLKQAKRNPEAVQELLRSYAHLMEAGIGGSTGHADPDTGYYGAKGAGCIILARTTNRILLNHRADNSKAPRQYHVEQPNTWGTWGGKIDDGEDPIHAVQREVSEEAQYHGEIEEIQPLLIFKDGSFTYHNFLVIIEDEFEPHLNWESQGFRWCEFGEWPSPLHFGLRHLLSDKASIDKIVHAIQQNSAIGTLHESVLDEEDTFESEIAGPSNGSYNFPWRVGTKHGFGNARWSGRGENMKVTVQWAADSEGDPVNDSALLIKIEQLAIQFIGQE
jgi:8-oxo-dGTP pyrophosphatase MutT (NUDIX family)